MFFSKLIYVQNPHLTKIDFDYLNYTRQEIENGYSAYSRFWIVKDEPGSIICQGGDCFINWPLQTTEYFFDDNDSLYQIVLTLSDTTINEAFLFPEVLMTFRNWCGDEFDYNEREKGNRTYYWYFSEEMREAETMMSLSKNIRKWTASQIMQINLRRMTLASNN
ncbi:MAG TPA: hypothetical protein VK870_16580 [Ignavibacteriaceae bacterium]|nr:hypothetical protein [Ignavibacteriaceae bacterium]